MCLPKNTQTVIYYMKMVIWYVVIIPKIRALWKGENYGEGCAPQNPQPNQQVSKNQKKIIEKSKFETLQLNYQKWVVVVCLSISIWHIYSPYSKQKQQVTSLSYLSCELSDHVY